MIWIGLLFSTLTASAYIPEYSMIASRAADQHGRGTYRIEQDITIRKEAEAFTVRETWYVSGENLMRVTLEGRGPLKGLVSGTVIYDGGTKAFADGKSIRHAKLGDEWLEPFFHFRSSRYFRSRLVNLRVTPQESLKDRPPLSSEDEIKYEPPSFIRLSRAGGGPAWAIGEKPTAGDSPTIWLEQDQFVLRKFKLSNNVMLRADDYAKYEDVFWYPRSRTYHFGDFVVQVQTVKVQAESRLSPKDSRFKSASLSSEKDAVMLPEIDGLKEFYLRFR